MKKLVQIFAFIIIVLATMNVMAQTKKLGFIASDSLMLIMPGIDSVNITLKAESKAYQTKLATMQEDFNTKYKAYIKDSATMLPSIKTLTIAELQDMYKRIQTFNTSADSTFNQRRYALVKPIQDKALKAIAAVAKENGYSYIFDSAKGFLLYKNESDDIMPLVKKKLGIKK